MSRQEQIRRTPRRRRRPVENPPLVATTFDADSSATDDLLDRIAAILETI